jgi:hypothetical protein
MEIINKLEFQERNKISVGNAIRRFVSHLHTELMRKINE